jgi:predicted porin
LAGERRVETGQCICARLVDRDYGIYQDYVEPGLDDTDWGRAMTKLYGILLGSVAALALTGAALAADMPTKKTPPAPAATNCYASFWTWLDSTPTDCPLSYMGVTVYGQIDLGGGYETHAAKFNKDFPQGVNEVIGKFSDGARWQWVPNGLSQSNVGVKIKEQVVPNWYIVGDVNLGFDPYSFQLSNGPKSLVDNNGLPYARESANSDSSRAGQWDNTRAYIGVSNPTYGTLTFGRQYAFTNDLVGNYDPFGGAYAFSLIGFSSTVVAGTGDTETARENTSFKYQVAYNGFRAGALAQVGGWDQDNGAQAAYQADLGFDYGGLSVDAVYAYAKDAVVLKVYSASTVPTPSDKLAATLADINAGVIAAKYKWNALTVFGGYEYARLSSPSDFDNYFPNVNGGSGNIYTLNGGYPGQIQSNVYVNSMDLQALWIGGKYAVLSNLDAVVGYYYEWQNNYTLLGSSSTTHLYNVKYQSASTLCAPATGAPGTNYSTCAGHTDAVSGMLDWRPWKRVDVYGGVMYSEVAGGMANGYTHTNNTAFTGGVRVSF